MKTQPPDHHPLKITEGDSVDPAEQASLVSTNASGDLALADLFEKVQRAKQEWEVTADSIPELICLINKQSQVVRVNRTVVAWNLSDTLDIQGKSLHALFHPYCPGLFCYLERFTQQALKRVDDGQPSQIEAFDQIRNRHYSIRVQPIAVAKSDPNNVAVVVVQDITERTEAAEAMRRYVQRLEAQDNIQRAILAARSPEEIIDTMIDLLHPLIRFDYAKVILNDTETNQYYVVTDDAAHRPNGRTARIGGRELLQATEADNRQVEVIDDLLALEVPVEWQSQLIAAGLRSYINLPLIAEDTVMGSMTLAAQGPDVYQREQLETLIGIADLLAIAAQQAQLSRQLLHTNQELTEALRARTEMIQNVSHELRTPLSLVYGYAELLLSGEFGEVSADQRVALKVIGDRSEQLRDMIDQLLALRIMDTIMLEPTLIDLSPWLDQITQAWVNQLARRNQKVTVKFDPNLLVRPIMGNPQSLKQAVENLLDNAAKFSPSGGLITVRLEERAGLAVISVQDHGIGIEASELKRLFSDFHQIDGQSTRHFRGMGIGLALCRKIVAAHGGEIWAESAGLNCGSTFCMALPVSQETLPAQTTSAG